MPDFVIPILIATGVIFAIGFICSAILVIASRFFSVEVNEDFTRFRECLPGINCGVCGYSGCDGYANALANDSSVATNRCIPGGAEAATKIADIKGVAAVETDKKTACVHCNGTCENTDTAADYYGIASCRAAMLTYGGNGLCNYGCLGFGDCAAACPVNAISLIDGVARVDINICIGCGLCAKTCPKGIISLIDTEKMVAIKCSNKDKGAVARKKCKVACIGCKKCESTCPTDAITVTDNLARIDYDKCVYCGKCDDVCPMGTIRSRK